MSNYSKLDYFLPMALVKESNSLMDIKGGKVATNNGATKVFEGFDFDGISGFIQTDNNPKTSKNFIQNDALVGTFVYLNNAPSSTQFILADGFNDLYQAGSNIYSRLTSNTFVSLAEPFISKTLYVVKRESESNVEIAKDGVIVATKTSVSSEVSDLLIKIGKRNSGDRYNGTISLVFTGAAIGVNQVAKNDHYRQFLTDLGINLSPEENKLAGATITDTLQGATGTDELKAT